MATRLVARHRPVVEHRLGPAILRPARDVVADRNWVVLIPGVQLHGLRAAGEAAEGPVTLLLGSSHLEGLSLPDHAALVSDPELGENTAALIAQLLLPVQSVEHATRIGPLLQQLLECSRPLAAGRVRRTSALAPLRSYLQGHVSEPIATEELARMSGLTVCHLIRAFHYEFGLPPHAYAIDGVEYYGAIGYLKAGGALADRITTVSPTYAAEIQKPESGMGLDGLLRHRSGVLSAILNGIDDKLWDPATDPWLTARFDAEPARPRRVGASPAPRHPIHAGQCPGSVFPIARR